MDCVRAQEARPRVRCGDSARPGLARAILHIGLEKTGTSSLQEFLQLNRELLLEREQIWVPDFMGRGSQWPLAVLAYAPSRCDDLTAPLGSPEARRCRLEEIAEQIRSSVQRGPDRVYCFSSEHLSSRLTTSDELQRLRNFLRSLFEDVSLVLYLREPIRLAISHQSTFVKMGLGTFQLPTPQQLCEVFHFQAIVERWQSVFAGCLQVRLFDPSLPGFDLIHDFAAAIGITSIEDYCRPKHVNASLDWTCLRLLSHINQLALEQRGQPLPRAALQRLVPLLEASSASPDRPHRAYQADPQIVAAYRDHYAAQEQWLLEHFFPRRPSLWNHPYNPTPADEGAEAQTLAVGEGEEILCRLIVDQAVNQAIPTADLVHCLDQAAWKGEQGVPLNLYDQQTCRELAQTLRSL